MGLLEKSWNEEEESFEIRLNGNFLFSAKNNETIRIIGELLQDMSEADDYATMVIG